MSGTEERFRIRRQFAAHYMTESGFAMLCMVIGWRWI